MSGMVWIPAGTFTMGGTERDFMLNWPRSARSRDDERPLHSVTLSGFWISETPVTNRQFKAFIDATAYITTAEKAPTLEEIIPLLPPGAPPPLKSLLFNPLSNCCPPQPISLVAMKKKLKKSEKPGDSIDDRWDHPVVHILTPLHTLSGKDGFQLKHNGISCAVANNS